MAEKKSGKKIAYIMAAWHQELNETARQAFGDAVGELVKIDDFLVPGALEMPLKAQQCARSGDYDAIICGAFVIDGGIYRHEFVAQAVLDGIMRVNLDEGVPVLSVSLTPHNYHEGNKDIRNFFRKHMRSKGEEAADAVKMLLGIESKGKATSEEAAPAAEKKS